MEYLNFWQHKSFLSTILLPFSKVFYLISKIRKHLAKPISFPFFVICVGNISVGGTGKTQVVQWIAKKLLNNKFKIAIICKGYKGNFKKVSLVKSYHDASFVGDEAKLLSNIADVIVTKDPRDAYLLLQELRPDIVILDDFLQNPYITKDLSLLVIDADRMFGNARLLPAGPLRQSKQEAMLITKARIAIGSKSIESRLQGAQDLGKDAFWAQITSDLVLDLTKDYVAFAGIGNPDRFFRCLKVYGASIIHEIKFSDHHNYTALDIAKLKHLAESFKATLITTPKDAVKLNNLLSFVTFEPILKIQAEQDLLNLIYEEIKKNPAFS
jgi:tetraacyldisaccharide 4'-kinase